MSRPKPAVRTVSVLVRADVTLSNIGPDEDRTQAAEAVRGVLGRDAGTATVLSLATPADIGRLAESVEYTWTPGEPDTDVPVLDEDDDVRPVTVTVVRSPDGLCVRSPAYAAVGPFRVDVSDAIRGRDRPLAILVYTDAVDCYGPIAQVYAYADGRVDLTASSELEYLDAEVPADDVNRRLWPGTTMCDQDHVLICATGRPPLSDLDAQEGE